MFQCSEVKFHSIDYAAFAQQMKNDFFFISSFCSVLFIRSICSLGKCYIITIKHSPNKLYRVHDFAVHINLNVVQFAVRLSFLIKFHDIFFSLLLLLILFHCYFAHRNPTSFFFMCPPLLHK